MNTTDNEKDQPEEAAEEAHVRYAGEGQRRVDPYEGPEMPAASYNEDLLNLREQTHGEYETTARIAQRLKIVIREEIEFQKQSSALAGRDKKVFTGAQLESLDSICVKMARIISGDPNFAEHWNDVSGYAKLITDRRT